MKDVTIPEAARLLNEQLPRGGVFLSSSDGEHPNVMTIGWGGINRFFNESCFLAPVRESRFTYGLMLQNGVFTVSVPLTDLRKPLAGAGSLSGRNGDKFAALGLTALPALTVNVPVVGECALHLECVTIGRIPLQAEQLDPLVLDRWYPTVDLHTLFLGRIVRCYRTDE